jgi:hypothetical protein
MTLRDSNPCPQLKYQQSCHILRSQCHTEANNFSKSEKSDYNFFALGTKLQYVHRKYIYKYDNFSLLCPFQSINKSLLVSYRLLPQPYSQSTTTKKRAWDRYQPRRAEKDYIIFFTLLANKSGFLKVI